MASPRIVLITGANTGIGLELVRALVQSSQAYTILVGGRSPEKVTAAIRSVETAYPNSASKLAGVQIDVESDEEIAQVAARVEKEYGHLDVLVNNAGAQLDHASGLTRRQVFLKNWDVNVAGAQLLTEALAPLLAKSTAQPMLLFLASGTASLTESDDDAKFFNKSPPRGFPKPDTNLTAYRSVKVGLNMVMREWHRILRNDGVQVYSISPGFLATGLGVNDPERLKAMGAGEPALGGTLLQDVIEGRHAQDVGKVVRRGGPQPW